MLDWRKIEAALERLARDWGSGQVDQRSDTGDKTYEFDQTFEATAINLTELAKDLAAELSHD